MKHRVFVEFPKVGLGNLLLIWSRAKVFSHINGYPLITSSWWGIRWGAWLRNENKKRIYWDYFRECSLRDRIGIMILKPFLQVSYEPVIKETLLPAKQTIFCFNQIAPQNDLFQDIRPYRLFIKNAILQLVKDSLLMQLQAVHVPEIAVHIRRGDFRKGNPITSTTFFINCIKFIRQETQRNLSVTVFTDAEEKEIRDVLTLENVRLAETKPDILDILQMSRGRILVLSQSSTFSYWAAFLSEAIVIKTFHDWQGEIRPREMNREKFEGKIDFDQPETLNPLAEALRKEPW